MSQRVCKDLGWESCEVVGLPESQDQKNRAGLEPDPLRAAGLSLENAGGNHQAMLPRPYVPSRSGRPQWGLANTAQRASTVLQAKGPTSGFFLIDY